MSEYSEHVKRLRSPATVFYEYGADGGALLRDAADLIEAQANDLDKQAKRIKELEAENAGLREKLEPYVVKYSSASAASAALGENDANN